MKKLLIATILGLCLLVLLGDYVCDKGHPLSHSDAKTNAFNAFNWKQKPRRVWDAITGRYFILGAGTVSSTSLLND